MTTKRTCDGCTACCKTHPILELSKPAGVWCGHCNIGKGCRIYGDHPQGCKDFVCQWIMGVGEDGDRPDKSQIVVDYVDIPGLDSVLMVFEVTEGALSNPFAWEVTRVLLSMGVLVCHLPVVGSNTLYCMESATEPVTSVSKNASVTINGRETRLVFVPSGA